MLNKKKNFKGIRSTHNSFGSWYITKIGGLVDNCVYSTAKKWQKVSKRKFKMDKSAFSI